MGNRYANRFTIKLLDLCHFHQVMPLARIPIYWGENLMFINTPLTPLKRGMDSGVNLAYPLFR